MPLRPSAPPPLRPSEDGSLGAAIVGVGDPTYGSLGTGSIEAAFFCFAFGTPLVQLLVLIALWFRPLRLAEQQTLFVAAEVLHAWSGLEVFVVSIIAALLEIGAFVKFIVAPYCGAVDAVLAEYSLPQLDGDDTCFTVSAELKGGCWLLFAASALSLLGSHLVLRACHAALERRRRSGGGGGGGGREPAAAGRGKPAAQVALLQVRLHVDAKTAASAYGGSE
jgi:hypothetical protein